MPFATPTAISARFSVRLVVALLLATLLASTVAAPAAQAVGGPEFVRLANEYRATKSLGPVSLHAAVDQIAVERANQMAQKNKMEHDLDYVKARLSQLGVCWQRLGEIIAWDTRTTHSYSLTMQQWIRSPGHEAILVGDYTAAGGSWTRSSGGVNYSAMIFIKACVSSTTTTTTITSIGRITLEAGSHTGYLFSGTTVTGSKTATLARQSGAAVSERAKIGGVTYLKVANGIWAGYWIRESYRAYIPGFFDRVSFAPKRLAFEAGTHIGFKFHSSGTWYDRKSATLPRASGADAVGWAIINGRPWFLVSNGIWGGYWVLDRPGIALAR